jgi:hypothetical protein
LFCLSFSQIVKYRGSWKHRHTLILIVMMSMQVQNSISKKRIDEKLREIGAKSP